MPATYEPIASQTLGSDAGTVTFSSIPATFTDLVLIVVGGGATSGASMRFRVNSDGAGNYSATLLRGDGSTASSTRISSQTSGIIGGTGGGSSTALDNIFFAHFQSYANTNVFKTVLGGNGTASIGVARSVSLWRSTSAIDSITVSLGGTFPTYDLITGSTFSLFGVKAA